LLAWLIPFFIIYRILVVEVSFVIAAYHIQKNVEPKSEL